MSIILVEEKPKITVQVLLENFVDADECIKDIMADNSPHRYIVSGKNKSQMPLIPESDKNDDADIAHQAIEIVATKQKKDLALAYEMQFGLLKETTSALQNKTITLSEADADCSTLVYFSMQAATDCLKRSKTKKEIDIVRNFLSTVKSTDYKFIAPEVDQQNKLSKLVTEKSFKEINTRRTEYRNFTTNEPPTYSEQEVLGHLLHLQRKLTQDEVYALTRAQFDLEKGTITLTNEDTDLTGLMIETAIHLSAQDGIDQKLVKEFATSMIQGQHRLNPEHVSVLSQINGLAA